MPTALVKYVRVIDYLSHKFGLVAMYTIFAMMAVLFLNAITRNLVDYPLSWCIEMAQFILAAYYTLGGGYSLKDDHHVRMDLIYERLSVTGKAKMDVITSVCMLGYLSIFLYGALSSTIYAIETNQRNFSMWNPPMAPIKVIMVTGIVLMLMQAIATVIKDIGVIRGVDLRDPNDRRGEAV